jgi:hypothetical protein
MSDDIEDDFPDLFMHYNFKTTMVRIIENHLVPANLRVKVEFAANPEASAEDIGRVWNKIDYWLATTNECVAIWASNPLAVATMVSAETHKPQFANPIMILPGEPTEEVIGYALQAKLTALGEDVVAFGSIEMENVDANGIVFNIIGNPDKMLPNMVEWMGEGNWFDKPWWHRDDGSMLDAQPGEDDSLVDIPEWAYSWDFLGKRPKPSAGVVISGRFKPRLVTDKDKDK